MRAEIDGLVYNLHELQVEKLPIAGLQDAGPIGISEFAKAILEAAKIAAKEKGYNSGLSKQDVNGLIA